MRFSRLPPLLLAAALAACAAGSQRWVSDFDPEAPREWRPEGYLTVADGMAHLYEVTRHPGVAPTEEDYRAAWTLYSRTYDAVEAAGWFDFDRAESEGFHSVDGFHHVRQEHLFDDRTLDPTRPESLLYQEMDDGSRVLVGVMYIARSLTEEGPQVAGPLTVWHYHPWGSETCFEERISRLTAAEIVNCPPDAPQKFRGPEMMHVWFVEHPEGPFASRMDVVRGVVGDPVTPEKLTPGAFRAWAERTHRGDGG